VGGEKGRFGKAPLGRKGGKKSTKRKGENGSPLLYSVGGKGEKKKRKGGTGGKIFYLCERGRRKERRVD